MVKINFQVRIDKFQDTTKDYIQEKMDRLGKYLTGNEAVTVTIDKISGKNLWFTQYKVAITVKMPRAYIKVENKGSNINKIVNSLMNPLQKKLARYSDQKWESYRSKKDDMEAPLDASADDVPIVFDHNIKRKLYSDDTPIYPSEAIEKMELLDNSSFLFKNIENGRYAMIYKNNDNGYTLVQPEK